MENLTSGPTDPKNIHKYLGWENELASAIHKLTFLGYSKVKIVEEEEENGGEEMDLLSEKGNYTSYFLNMKM